MIEDLRESVKRRVPSLLPAIRTGAQVIRAADGAIRQELARLHIRKILKEKRERFVELGAGAKKGKGGWVTIDISKHSDIFWDLRRGIPFPDESVAKIYSSHLFEHLSFSEGQQLLEECRRVLVSGGVFSICVPNARLFIEAYLESNALGEHDLCAYEPAFNKTTRIDYVNYIAYMASQHKYMFDEANLLHILKARGFRNVCLRHFDSSLDLKERDFESIYAEAEK